MARPTLAMLALVLAACRASGPRTDADRALHEFRGAYPDEASPTGVVRAFDLTAAPARLRLLDGDELDVWAYDGQVPGPTLRVRLGETVRVQFHNRLPQETTVHWHGVRLPNPMDGVPHLTQPPVPPGGDFTYEFTPKDAGTFWFHPHVRSSEQVERGLYGVLVVEDASPPPYSRDLVWVVDDWRVVDGAIDPRFNTRHDLAMDGRWGNVLTVNGQRQPTIEVGPGERLRLRLLNSSNGRVYRPDFGELDAQIIAVDGLYLRAPIPAGQLELAPGNRVDVDVVFDKSPAGPLEVVDRYLAQRPTVLARFALTGAPVETPRFASPARGQVPRWDGALAVPAAHEFRLDAQAGGPFGIAWTIDGVAFMGHDHAMPPALTLPRGRFARLRFVNVSPRIHPIHTHGMFFRLLARDGVPADEPFFRDTVLIQPRQTVDLGLVPTDLGTWMMHCHILEHAEAGMMTTLAVVDGSTTPAPPRHH